MDFGILNEVFKIGWIKRCMNADPNVLWFYIPVLILEKLSCKLGSLPFATTFTLIEVLWNNLNVLHRKHLV